MFGFFNKLTSTSPTNNNNNNLKNNNNNKGSKKIIEDEDDYVDVLSTSDDEWEEVKGSNKVSPRKSNVVPSSSSSKPISISRRSPSPDIEFISADNNNNNSTSLPPRQRIVSLKEVPVSVSVPTRVEKPIEIQIQKEKIVPEPAWKAEISKRDKTPYVIASSSPSPYAVSGTGAPYTQSSSSSQSYISRDSNDSTPYCLSSVSPVSYVTTHSVPVQESLGSSKSTPYCIAY